MASGSDDATVRIWDPLLNKETHRLDKHFDAVNSVAWGKLNNRTVLASAGDDGSVLVWDPLNESYEHVLQSGFYGGIDALEWITYKGTPLLVAGGASSDVEVWDPVSRQKAVAFKVGSPIRDLACVEISRDRFLIAAISDASYEDDKGVVEIWELDSGESLRRFDMASDIVTGLAWGMIAQELVLACCGESGTVQLCEVKTDGIAQFHCDSPIMDVDMTREGLLAMDTKRSRCHQA